MIETAGKNHLTTYVFYRTYLCTTAFLVNYICDLERCSHQESLSRAEKYQLEISLVEYEQQGLQTLFKICPDNLYSKYFQIHIQYIQTKPVHKHEMKTDVDKVVFQKQML